MTPFGSLSKARRGSAKAEVSHNETRLKLNAKKKKKKKSALVICRNRQQFWTTQKQFWQWVREGRLVKTQDDPLTGAFRLEHEQLMVLLSNTVLNLAHPNHLREALASRRVGMSGRL
jgi:hypothetical protein